MKQPIHIAIHRTVKPGCEDDFEAAILRFFADAQDNEATLGAQLLRPLPGSDSRTYGIMRSFNSKHDRDRFYTSERFKKWEQAVAPLVESEYARRELAGLEAFFTDPLRAMQPPLWKMAVVTWLGVWPSVFAVTSLGGRWLLSDWPFWLAVGIETGLVVALLTWIVMPMLTRLMKPWLIPPNAHGPQERNGS